MGFNVLKFLYVNLIIICNSGYKFFFDLFSYTPKEIVKEAEKPSDGLKKVQSSLMHLVPSDFSDNNFYNSKINSQVKDKCSCCYSKLSPSQKQYFAFDKEYCYKCWNKINLNY